MSNTVSRRSERFSRCALFNANSPDLMQIRKAHHDFFDAILLERPHIFINAMANNSATRPCSWIFS